VPALTPELLVRVPSFTGEGTYDITRHGGVLACDCPAFGNSRERPQTCKHLKVYLLAEKAASACRRAHGTPGRLTCQTCLLVLLARIAAKAQRERKRKGLPR
jgi:hypothetical protein